MGKKVRIMNKNHQIFIVLMIAFIIPSTVYAVKLTRIAGAVTGSDDISVKIIGGVAIDGSDSLGPNRFTAKSCPGTTYKTDSSMAVKSSLGDAGWDCTPAFYYGSSYGSPVNVAPGTYSFTITPPAGYKCHWYAVYGTRDSESFNGCAVTVSVSKSTDLTIWYFVKPDTTAAKTCTDTEGGNDIFVRGSSTGYNSDFSVIYTAYDECKDSSTVYETWCQSDGRVNGQYYACANGCDNGACIEPKFCFEGCKQVRDQCVCPDRPKGFIDLAVTELATVGELASGKQIEIVGKAMNDGNITAQTVAGKIKVDGQSIPVEPVLGFGYVYSNQEASFKAKWTATKGAHTISFSIDPENSISESDETNNLKSISITIPDSTTKTCTDTDGGKNYDLKGTATSCTGSSSSGGGSGSCAASSDYCLTDKILVEQYCDSESNKNYETYSCANGCVEGACLKSTTQTFDLAISNMVLSSEKPVQGSAVKVSFNVKNVGSYPTNYTGYRVSEESGGTIASANMEKRIVLKPGNSITESFNHTFTHSGKNTLNVKILSDMDFNAGNDYVSKTVYVSEGTIKTCTDSDGGKDYYTYGSVKSCGSSSSSSSSSSGGGGASCFVTPDYCTGSTLTEYYCDSNQAMTEKYVCANGCDKGACTSSTSEVAELTLKPNGSNNYKLSFKNKAGVEYNEFVFGLWNGEVQYGQSTSTTSGHRLVTSEGDWVDDEDYFIVAPNSTTAGMVSRILQLKEVAPGNSITDNAGYVMFRDTGSGDTYEVTYAGLTGDLVLDGNTYKVQVQRDTSDAKIRVSVDNYGRFIALDRLYTLNGLTISFNKANFSNGRTQVYIDSPSLKESITVNMYDADKTGADLLNIKSVDGADALSEMQVSYSKNGPQTEMSVKLASKTKKYCNGGSKDPDCYCKDGEKKSCSYPIELGSNQPFCVCTKSSSGVEVSINPKVHEVKRGESAAYEVTIRDLRSREASSSQAAIDYLLKIEGLKYPNDGLPSYATLSPGGKAEYKLTVYTNRVVIDSPEQTAVTDRARQVSNKAAGNAVVETKSIPVYCGGGSSDINCYCNPGEQKVCSNGEPNCLCASQSSSAEIVDFKIIAENGDHKGEAKAKLIITEGSKGPKYEVAMAKGWNIVSPVIFGIQNGAEVGKTDCMPDDFTLFSYFPFEKKYGQYKLRKMARLQESKGISLITGKAAVESINWEDLEMAGATKEEQELLSKYSNSFTYLISSPVNSWWAYSSKDCLMRGTMVDEFKEPGLINYIAERNVKLVKGWNFLMISPDMAGYSLNDFNGNCEIKSAYMYQDRNWKQVTNSQFREGQSGYGMVLRTDGECVLGFKSSLPPPLPNLPTKTGDYR
ncbi:hypothetical protein HYU11_03595 [Candidatus Woesearchaeota archaeon]|nr:hypothetical protein [Candidatus Woesearchaeota archaeon]